MIEFENVEKTPIEKLGEFGLIDRLLSANEIRNNSTLYGPGDDAAIVDAGDHVKVITTDLLVEGVHFDMVYTPLKHLGYKSVVVNLSDICAMNAVPKQITVSISVSSRYTVEALEELYRGIYLACNKYHVDLIGGDTTSSRSGLVISVTALGEGKKEDIVYRKGACKNDILCVTGDLGAAYMGFQVLNREKTVFLENPKIQPDLEGKDYILERQLKPEARTDIIDLFRELKIRPTSMIDISDGLASEILHLCKHSDCGMDVFEEKIPIDTMTYNTALEFHLDPTMCAMNGGEDYELLFTIKQSDYEKLKGNPNISFIGYVTEKEKGKNLITKSGPVVEITAQGWDSFRSSASEQKK
jgi:thiamine-monophosphate kinase